MSFSQHMATKFVPLMARLILAAAFIPAGWNKVWTNTTYTGEDATRLKEMGVGGPPSVPTASIRSSSTALAAIRLASLNQDQPAETPAAAEEPQEQPSATPPPPVRPAPEPAKEPVTIVDPVRTGLDSDVVEARALYRIALLVEGRWPDLKPYSSYLAWAAGFTELIGGALLLVGLFSRIWALGLAIAMVVAFLLTSLDPFLATGWFGMMKSSDGILLFNRVFCQLGLFALAFGVFLTGPGPMSLDGAIFRRSPELPPAVDPAAPRPRVI